MSNKVGLCFLEDSVDKNMIMKYLVFGFHSALVLHFLLPFRRCKSQSVKLEIYFAPSQFKNDSAETSLACVLQTAP